MLFSLYRSLLLEERDERNLKNLLRTSLTWKPWSHVMLEYCYIECGLFPLWDAHAVNHGSCIHHLGLGNFSWWIQLPWFPSGVSYSEMCLQGIMIVVFIKTNIQTKMWIQLPWFTASTSNYKARLQGIMVVVFITLGLDNCFDEYNYHDSLQACQIARFACSESW